MSTADLPLLNAVLNATSAVLVLAGWACVRRGRIRAHRALMLSAVTVSTLFLASYLTHKFLHGHTVYRGQGAMRTAYLALLGSHTTLAVATVPLVGITLVRALRGRFAQHRRIARWTLPIWLYVSITGVAVYVMLYGPGTGGGTEAETKGQARATRRTTHGGSSACDSLATTLQFTRSG